MSTALAVRLFELTSDQDNPIAIVGSDEARVAAKTIVGKQVSTLLEDTGRASAYHSKSEMDTEAHRAHNAMLDMDRDLYAVLLGLPGATDRSRMRGVENLIGSRSQGKRWLLTDEQEQLLINDLLRNLSVPRVLNTFLELKAKRIN